MEDPHDVDAFGRWAGRVTAFGIAFSGLLLTGMLVAYCEYLLLGRRGVSNATLPSAALDGPVVFLALGWILYLPLCIVFGVGVVKCLRLKKQIWKAKAGIASVLAPFVLMLVLGILFGELARTWE